MTYVPTERKSVTASIHINPLLCDCKFSELAKRIQKLNIEYPDANFREDPDYDTVDYYIDYQALETDEQMKIRHEKERRHSEQEAKNRAKDLKALHTLARRLGKKVI